MGLSVGLPWCLCDSTGWIQRRKPWWIVAIVMLLLTNSKLSLARHKTALEQCKQGKYHDGYALAGGKRAGLYTRLGNVEDFDECVELCCSVETCKVALQLKTSCFQVTCDESKPHLCTPIPAKHSKYHPMLFLRVKKEPQERDESIRGRATCQRYSGTTCANYVNQSAMYYVSTVPVDEIDHRLQTAVHFIQREFESPCREYALKTMCMFWLIQCKDNLPKPMMLCKEDCNTFLRRKCSDQLSEDIPQKVAELLPDCKKLHWARNSPKGSCLRVPDDVPKLTHTLSTEPLTAAAKPTVMVTPHSAAAANILRELASVEGNTSTVAPTVTKALPTNATLVRTTLATTAAATTAVPTVPQSDDKLKQTHASIVTLNSTDDVNLSVETPTPKSMTTKTKKKTTPTAVHPAVVTHPPMPTVKSIDAIQVSAGDNKVITLPMNSVVLFASPWPKPDDGAAYEFNWIQVSAPKDSTGYMEGQHTNSVHLTKLDVVGVYQFKVQVKGASSYGEGFVNVTVKPAPRSNHPPRADVQPKEQTITLPTNEVVIDGTKSTDDDKIAAYKWELTKAPIDTHDKVSMLGQDGPVLQLKKLTPGVYTFKLTVTDSDGETDSVESTVIVNDEKDYPPTARAGNDVVLTMPKNHVTLYGNGSLDDKGIVSYEWSKSPDSPKVGDIQGTDKPSLIVSNLVVGDYTFILKVTDAAGQSSESRVTVVVQPERNLAPKADAGPDKDLVFPDDSTTLDASKSSDDQRIVSYAWEKVSGPKALAMRGRTEAKLHLTKLVEGKYVFSVTVTDDRGLSSADSVTVNVKKDANIPPVASAGPDVIVVLPNRAARLDGSKSKDDQWIVSHKWTREGSSPAAGDVINGSAASPILQLANMVEGVYSFTLAVTDNKGLVGYDSATIVVKEDADSLHLVELYLDVDILKFSEENKKQLLRKLSVLLNVDDSNVVVDWIRAAGYGKGMLLMFHVMAQHIDRMLDGQLVADIIRQKIGYHGTLFEYNMLSVQPYVCRNNCSGHGTCDKNTKMCVCDSFWMSNVFKANIGAMESNCDWSILYVSVSLFCILLLFLGLSWLLCYCFSRKTRRRRRGRYIAVRSEDGDESKENIMLMTKGGKMMGHSLTFTESDDDSEEETTVFDKKRMMNGVVHHSNGSVNGMSKKRIGEHGM